MTETALQPTEAQSVADIVKDLHEGQVITFADGDTEAEILIVPEGKQVVSIKAYIDEYRAKPDRRKGTAKFYDLKSIINHVKRFKDTDTVFFADNDRTAPSLTAVYDYNKAGKYEDGGQRFGEHRAHYAFPLSDEWKIWHGLNGKRMTQKDFAEFLENRITDIIQVQDDITNPKIKEFAQLLGGEFASPSRLVALSKGMEVNEGLKVKNAVNLATGESTVQYISEHQDAAGAPLKVPNLFMIAIPVFVAGSLYQMAVRLRYRIEVGSIRWFYELYRADKVFEHAFDEACKQASDETAVPLFVGAQEK